MKFFYSQSLLLVTLALVPAAIRVEAAGLTYTINNPLSSNITSIESLIYEILNVLIIIAIPLIVLAIIWGGFTYVTANGNPEKIKTGSRTLTYALIGAVLILGAVALAEIIQQMVQSF